MPWLQCSQEYFKDSPVISYKWHLVLNYLCAWGRHVMGWARWLVVVSMLCYPFVHVYTDFFPICSTLLPSPSTNHSIKFLAFFTFTIVWKNAVFWSPRFTKQLRIFFFWTKTPQVFSRTKIHAASTSLS